MKLLYFTADETSDGLDTKEPLILDVDQDGFLLKLPTLFFDKVLLYLLLFNFFLPSSLVATFLTLCLFFKMKFWLVEFLDVLNGDLLFCKINELEAFIFPKLVCVGLDLW